MNKKVLVTRPIPEKGLAMLRDKGYAVTVHEEKEPLSQEKLIRLLKKDSYDAVLSLLTDKIDAAVYDAAPTVKIYANYASGFDNIDLAEAARRGIAVTNAPAAASAEAVAEHAIALIMAAAKRIPEADRFVRRGDYHGWDPMLFIGTDALGKTLGLIGAGRIGECAGKMAKALGMNVIYHDMVRNERLENVAGATYLPALEDVLKQADFVSLHVPLLDSTRHLIDEARLKLMKPSAILVNTSRGPVVDEAALEKALEAGVIRGAALDVFEGEPRLARGLAKLDNAILTPHIASASEKARDEMAEIAADNIIDFFEGRMPRNAVKPPAGAAAAPKN